MIRRLLLWYVSLAHVFHLTMIVAYMGLIFFLSAQRFNPDRIMSIWECIFFNFCHVPLYAGLSFIVVLYLQKVITIERKKRRVIAYILVAAGIVLLYGVSDEFHQSFTGRNPDPFDLGSDLIGGLSGALLVGFLIDRLPSPRVFVLFGTALACAALLVAYLGAAL